MGKRPKSKGDSAPTIHDVARAADVSVVTVSRVFNDYPHVSARMKTRVLAAAGSIGFSPKLVAKPRRIAVIVGHLDQLHGGGYKVQLLMRFIGCASRHGYAVEFIPAENIDLAVQRSVDGVIEFGLTSDEINCLKKLPDIPIVLINKEVPSQKRWNTVCSDHFGEGRMAAESLLKRGHRTVAIVLDETSGWSAEQRRSGYASAMKAKFGEACPQLVFSAADQSVTQIAERLVAERCTGLINLSDNVGLPLLSELTAHHGRRVPQDLSVVMLENESVSAYMSPPLTTVEQPLQLLAEAAVAGLINAMDNNHKAFRHSFPSRLIERESVQPLR